jgi:hypothetical protein
MDMFLISNAVSLSLLAVYLGLARGTLGVRRVFWLSAGLVLPLSMIGWIALAMQAGVTAVLMLACQQFRPKPKIVMLVATAAMVASYGILFLTKPKLREVLRLRREFPIVSISERLAYEAEETKQAGMLAPEIELRLVKTESNLSDGLRWSRSYWLELLHSRTVGDFVLAVGNGRKRMPGLGAESVELPPSQPVPLPRLANELPYNSDPASPVDVVDQTVHEVPAPTPGELLSMHDSGFADFLNPGMTGYVIDRNHVAGFSSHRFSKIPDLGNPMKQRSSWKIARLELVSLLKHEVPVAYVSSNLPQMDELRDAPTRPLDEFERQSIDRLRFDEDVMIDDTADRIRMIGSLRAAKDCLKCHSVQRGELLGALTYELVPVSPTRKKAAQVSTPSS